MNPPTEDLIQQAIHSARAGDRRKAQALLAQAVRQEPGNARAWYLLSQVEEAPARSIQCLERVLVLQPENAQARERLAHIQAGQNRALDPAGGTLSSPGSKKRFRPWVWAAGGLGSLLTLLCLCVLAAGLYGTATRSTQVAALPAVSQAPAEWPLTTPPSKWTPAFTLAPSATLAPTASPTLAPATEQSAIPPAALPVSPAAVAFAPAPPAAGNTLRVYFFDVGQGDATLIRAPGGQNVLVDGGEADSGVVQYLQGLGVQRIDLMIATHSHSDHIGGLAQVLRAFPVSRVAANGQVEATSAYEAFLDAIDAARAQYVEARRGDVLPAGEIDLHVLHPPDLAEADLNENSLVLQFTYGNTTFLMMGDAGERAEKSLIASGLPLKADVLKVGHHGSDTGSSPAFLSLVRPQAAVYFAGVDNPLHLPDPGTIAGLAAAGAQVYGTDWNGTILVAVDAGGYTVRTNRNEARAQPLLATPTNPPPASIPGELRIVSLTSPISPGATASLTAKTAPGASCTIQVYTKSGPSQAQGLEPKTADSRGLVSWTWKVGTRTTPGDWRIVVTVTVHGQTYTQETPFTVR